MKALWFVGDKETTLLLHLYAREVDAVVFVDPGFYPPQIYDYLIEAERHFGFKATRVEVETEDFEGRREDWCRYLREDFLLPYLSSTGFSLVYEPLRNPEPTPSPVKEVFPLKGLSDFEIWRAIKENGLPFCSLYLEGKKYVGCSPSEEKRKGKTYTQALKNMGYL